jgi:hypothetical protein
MAETMKISVGEYAAYESGQKDFSFSFLQNAARHTTTNTLPIPSPKKKPSPLW